ncbi:SPOR domain-containing protein [Oceanobacillus sojae]|uniref:SPOR domain-containing protein n=1 Tax=Oceanobacillus sojae TaxID=582851 RepID=UPI0009887C12|nr:SPOR domain-containing protein [Oceanobacillus sojae]
MTKQKPHTIDDTKGTWTYKVKKSSTEAAADTESAAAVEKGQDEPDFTTLPAVNSMKKGKSLRKINIVWKAILVSGISAIVVGTVIGFILFRMFVQVDAPASAGNPSQGTAPVAQPEKEEADSGIVTRSLDSLESYIIQAGIFSEKENADSLIANLTSLGISTVFFEKDGQYYLMAGVGPTEDAVKSLAASLSNNQAELYVKEWGTEAREIEMTEAEDGWLTEFQGFFTEQLQQVDLNQPIADEEITALVNQAPEGAEEIAELVTSLTEMMGEPSSYQLLNWMKVYNEL